MMIAQYARIDGNKPPPRSTAAGVVVDIATFLDAGGPIAESAGRDCETRLDSKKQGRNDCPGEN